MKWVAYILEHKYVQACLLRSGVPRDSLLERQSPWDFASITLGCAKRSLFYVIYFWSIRASGLQPAHQIALT